jgi:hypothetical protein
MLNQETKFNPEKDTKDPVNQVIDTGLDQSSRLNESSNIDKCSVCSVCNKKLLDKNYYTLTYHSPPGTLICSNNCLFEFVAIEMLVGEMVEPKNLISKINKVQEELE